MPKKLDPKVAEKVMLKAGLKPLEPYKNARANWKCRCLKCKKIVAPLFQNVQNDHAGCIYCARRKVDEKDANKIIAKAGFIPKEKFKGTNSKWKLECKTCKSITSPKYSSLVSGTICLICSRKKQARKKMHSDKKALTYMQKANLKPLEPYRGVQIKWKCRCMKCKKIVYPLLISIMQGQGGCIYCQENGFNYKKPALLYIIFHEEFNSIKVGVTNNDSKPDRLKVHTSAGWKVFKKFAFKEGITAYETETKILSWLRKELRLPIHLNYELMPQFGYTETVSADSITVLEIQKKVEKLIRGYRSNP